MNEHLTAHVIAQLVSQPWKDVIKTARKQSNHTQFITSGKSSVSTARYLLEKWSLVKSEILDYTSLYLTLPVSDVLII